MKLKARISFIGFGRMGGALAAGAMSAGVVRASNIIVYDPDSSAMRRAAALGIKRAASEAEAAKKSDLVFLCVKPQQMSDTLTRLGALSESERAKRCFVSIAAGVTIAKLQKALGRKVPVLRVMPNTPALLRAGASAISRGSRATTRHEAWVRTMLDAVGESVAVPEKLMNAVTAVSGSGPAYVFFLAEAMIDAAVKLGLKRDLASRLVRQTIFGGGLMLRRQQEDAAELRRQVTSPGGTTAAAIVVLEGRKFKRLVFDAITAAARRSAQLSKA